MYLQNATAPVGYSWKTIHKKIKMQVTNLDIKSIGAVLIMHVINLKSSKPCSVSNMLRIYKSRYFIWWKVSLTFISIVL